jgi:hypothetical protein
VTHQELTSAVRASELLAPTTAERHGTYLSPDVRVRLANGCRTGEGSRILGERIEARLIPGTDGNRIS